MSQWDRLLMKALSGLESLERDGLVVDWRFGGGTALMQRLHHRDSKDIDLFIQDPQYLGYLSPRLADQGIWETADYDETSTSLKLIYDEGEIDFIVASPVSDLPLDMIEFAGRCIPTERPAEIILKKFCYRGALFKPRDVFDTAAVLHSEFAEELRGQAHLAGDMKDIIIKRVTSMPPAYFMAAMEELDIFDDWRHIAEIAMDDVLSFLHDIPQPCLQIGPGSP